MSNAIEEIPALLITPKVSYVRYRDNHSNLQTVVTRSIEGRLEKLAINIEQFRLLQTADENPVGPRVLAQTTQHCMMSAYPDGPALNVVAIIAKVTCNYNDSIRAVYDAIDATTPLCLVHRDDLKGTYNELDVGNYIKIYKGKYNAIDFNVFRSLKDIPRATPAPLVSDTEVWYIDYAATLSKSREKLVEKYTKDVNDVGGAIGVGLFTFSGLKATYSDTTIEFATTEDVQAVIKKLNSETKNDFQSDLLLIVSACESPITVNGTRVSGKRYHDSNHSVRYCVNDKLVSKDDYQEVIDRVTCYPGNQESYDEFVDLVSRMSLRFHRLVQNGVKFYITTSHFFGDKYASHMNISDGSIHLPIRKLPKKNLEVFWMSEWRKVDTSKQDSFVKFVGTNDYRYRDGMFAKVSNANLKAFLIANYLGHKELRSSIWSYTSSDIPEGANKIANIRVKALQLLINFNTYLVDSDKVRFGYSTAAEYANVRGLISSADILIGSLSALIEESERVLQRSKKLLDEICDTPKVVKLKLKDQEGYRVEGASGKLYFVNESTASVSDFHTGSHICIVNGGVKNTKGYDYLTSVIGALLSDKYTAKDIHTLGV